MPTVPASVIDALTSLLEAELNSIFRVVDEGFPYLNRAVADVRRTIAELAEKSRQHATQLAELIDSLGGVATPRQIVRSEDQYLAYLSLNFLLPKLVAEKEILVQRYENTRIAIAKTNPEVAAMLDPIVAEQQDCLKIMSHAAENSLKQAKRAS